MCIFPTSSLFGEARYSWVDVTIGRDRETKPLDHFNLKLVSLINQSIFNNGVDY